MGGRGDLNRRVQIWKTKKYNIGDFLKHLGGYICWQMTKKQYNSLCAREIQKWSIGLHQRNLEF